MDGNVTSHTDRNGYETTFGYTNGNLTSVTDEAGRSLAIVWNANGDRIETVTDPANRSVTYGYTSGRLSSVTDVAQNTWAFDYEQHLDGRYRITSLRKPRNAGSGLAIVNEYDPNTGRVYRQTDELGSMTQFNYYGPEGVSSEGAALGATFGAHVALPDGSSQQDEYADNLLVRTVELDGITTVKATFTRDPSTLGVATEKDGLGNTWTFAYDGNGNRRQVIDPLGRVTSMTHNSSNRLVFLDDGEGVRTTYAYDGNGNLTSVSTPLNGTQTRTVTYEYNDSAHPGDMTKMIDERGKQWLYEYDDYGMLEKATSPTSAVSTFEFNNVGWLLRSVPGIGNQSGANPNNWDTLFSNHTPHGDARTITDPLNRVTTLVFDEHRNLVSETDAANRTSSWVFNAADQLIEIHRPDTSVLYNTYWPGGMLKTQVDGAGAVTEYSYTSANLLRRVKDPSGRYTSFRYDSAGRLDKRWVGTGLTCNAGTDGCVQFGYNTAGELNSINYLNDTAYDVTNTVYDDAGRKISETTPAGTTTWAWDNLGRLQNRVSPVEGTVAYTYDGMSDLVKTIAYPNSGGTVTYTYDSAGRRKTVTDLAGNVSSLTWDNNDRLSNVVFPTATTNQDVLAYNNANELTSINYRKGTADLASVTYGRDGTGMLTSSTPTNLPGDAARTYGYTPLVQLETVSGEATTYDYDAADNLVRLTSGATQAFDVGNELCWHSPSGATGTCATPPSDAYVVGHDSRGNFSSMSLADGAVIAKYDYDEADRLVEASIPSPVDEDARQYTPLPDARIMSTISGAGTCDPSPCARVTGGNSIKGLVLGQGGIPTTGVSAVALNVSILGPSADGWAKVNKNPGDNSSAALIYYTAGEPASAMAIAVPDANGYISVLTQKNVDVVFDVVGYFEQPSWGGSGAVFHPVAPERLMDSRTPNNMGSCSVSGGAFQTCTRLSASTNVRVQVAGQAGMPTNDLVAVAVNMSAMDPAADGVLRANLDTPFYSTSTLWYEGGENRSMTTMVEVATDGTITLRSSQQTDVLIDIVGYYTAPEGSDGAVFVPVVPARATKTVSQEGTCIPSPCDRMTQGESVRYKVTGVGDVPEQGAAAVAFTIGIEAPAADGWAKVNYQLAVDGTHSAAATIHYQANQNVSDVVIAEVDDQGYIEITTQKAIDVVIDVTGWYQPLRGTWTYDYSPDGLRTKKTSPLGDTVTTYTWDRNSAIPLLLSETTGAETTRWTYGPGGMPLAQHNPDGTTSYLHADQLGNTRLLTNTAGDIEGTYTYDPYGNTTSHTGTRTTPLQWGGGYRDTETSFVYLRARYYIPAAGIFLQRDPLQSISREAYGYVGGNPLNASDPLGLLCVGRFCAPSKQDVANAAGGLLDGVTLGNARNITSALGVENRVNWDSGYTGGARVVGWGILAPFAVQHAGAYQAYSAVTAVPNLIGDCRRGTMGGCIAHTTVTFGLNAATAGLARQPGMDRIGANLFELTVGNAVDWMSTVTIDSFERLTDC